MITELNIAYTLYREQIYMLLVSMQSIITNHHNIKINFYILMNEFFTYEDISALETFNKVNNCNIHFINCNQAKFIKLKNFVKFNPHFYSFDLANLIPEDKVLYLDANTLVASSLLELYNEDLKNCLCKIPEFLFVDAVNQNLNENFKKYANSAIMLMNLKKWRDENVTDTLLRTNFSKYQQKALNQLACFNLIIQDFEYIDYCYGYTEISSNTKKLKISCSEHSQNRYKQLCTHLLSPKIILFTSNEPLQQKSKNSYANLWWKYAEQTPIYEEIKQFRQLNKYKLSATSAQNSFNYSWLLSRIFPYIKPYWFRILVGFAISIPLGLLDGVTALALKPYMDYVVGNKALEFSFHGHSLSITSIQMAWILPIGIILFAAIQGCLRYLNSYLSAWVSRKITIDVRFDLFNRLINMHPQFFDDNSSGIINSRYIGDPKTASASIVDNLRAITTDICGAVGLIAVMMYSSWKLAFVGVLVLCIAFIPVALIRKRIRETSNKNMVISGNITTNMNETHSGSKVMTAYGLQERQEKLFHEQILESFKISMSLTKRTAWMSPLMYQIASFGIAIVLGYGTYLISIGQMTAGSFASFVTSLLLLYKPVKSLGGTLTGIQNVFVAMGRVFELFDLAPAIVDCENPKTLKGLNNGITFQNVEFEYVPNKTVLKNLNLFIPKNETLAIVGNSGGGKSTLVNLIPRFYEVKNGAVLFDGTNIKEFSLKSLRQNISMVFQDNFLYTGTIKDNILMGNPDANANELMDAIKAAHLEEMIQELPDGLDTELGERGLTLSGGQRQRVAIARAMLRNAPIVILDEATSALDNESEAIVQKAMDNLMKNRTVFIIAHRLSTIKNADRIAVINEGELVELGSHEELMKIENGQYKALYEMQFKKQEVK